MFGVGKETRAYWSLGGGGLKVDAMVGGGLGWRMD